MTIQDRIKAPTPPFFQKIRNTGLLLAAVGTAIVSAPVALPALLVKAAGYLVVAGTVASAVSQSAVAPLPKSKSKPHGRKRRS